MDYTSEDVFMGVLPFFHIYGLVSTWKFCLLILISTEEVSSYLVFVYLQ